MRCWPLVAVSMLAAQVRAASGIDPPVQGLKPVDGILAAYQSHSIVALGEVHGYDPISKSTLTLIRDPRFARVVDDIVVEFGNARYQSLIDRYVNGAEISEAGLRKVWRDTTIPTGIWDLPIYERLYSTVRAVNQRLPQKRRLRVLLGDPPIDWSAVRTKADLMVWVSRRDSYPAELVEREVLRRGRRALLLYGAWHITHAGDLVAHDLRPRDRLVPLLEHEFGAKVFSISMNVDDLTALCPGIDSLPVPSLVPIRGTALERAINPNPWMPKGPLGEQFDAVLYLGPSSSMTQTQPLAGLSEDKEYVTEKARREALRQ